MNKITKYICFSFILFIFSCDKTNKTVEPIIINKILNPELEKEFRKKDLTTLYPKLLTPQNFDAKRDTIIVKKIKDFQNSIINGLKSEKIDWNVNDSEISIFTRIYFDNTGQIEYFAFKVNNDSVKLKSLEQFKNILKKNISYKDLGIVRKTSYNYCVNFKLPVKK